MLDDKKITGVLAVAFVTLSLAFVLHRNPTFAGGFVGHLMGIIGASIMCLTLIYPFKKRILKRRGKKNPIQRHIYYGLIGPCLVVIHSAHKFANLIGVIAFLSMFMVVFSGIVGRFLYRKVNLTLKQHQSDLSLLRGRLEELKKDTRLVRACVIAPSPNDENDRTSMEEEQMDLEEEKECDELWELARSIAEAEHIEKAFSGTKRLFSRWIRIHYLLTILLFSVMIVHILTTSYYGFRWLR
jgi:hypothetical protein